MNCFQCQKETNNPKFCSHSCAATYGNRNKKIASRYKCYLCGVYVSYNYNKNFTVCKECKYTPKHLEKYKVRRIEKDLNLPCKCRFCGREYIYNRGGQGFTKSKCNSCMVNKYKLSIKQKCLDYKGGKCQRCGYDKCKRALTFHHKDPTQKKFGISGSHARKWEKIQKELDKCMLVCSNCHMELHDEQEGIHIDFNQK